MSQKPDPSKSNAALREVRLKAALKANLARRKAQATARAADQDDRDGSDDTAHVPRQGAGLTTRPDTTFATRQDTPPPDGARKDKG